MGPPNDTLLKNDATEFRKSQRMAEKDLDSFFAKKDKSKKKPKSKITIDDLAPPPSGECVGSTPTVLTSEKKKKKKPKDKNKVVEPASAAKAISKEEDAEWNDFESEEVDYSGLKIQNLQITAKEEEEEQNEEREVNSDSDEDGERTDPSQQGPWNKEGGTQPESTQETPAPRQEEPAPATPVVKSGKYVPPSMRGRTDSSEQPTSRRGLKNKKNAPDLRNMEDFPTLGANPLPQEIDTDTRQFENVRQGWRSQEGQQHNTAPRLQLGNKYGALSNSGE